MKQAIQEGFILDVLAELHALPELLPAGENDRGRPRVRQQAGAEEAAALRRERTRTRSARKPRSSSTTSTSRSGAQHKIDGQARAMVVCNGIARAIEYFQAISAVLQERKSPFKAIVAFSGEHAGDGKQVTEATLNGFPSNKIAETFREEPVPLPRLRRQVPDRLRRAVAPHDVRRQTARRDQGGPNPLPPQPRPARQVRHLRARFRERRRDDHPRLPGLLPDDGAERRHRPEQAPRPAGAAR